MTTDDRSPAGLDDVRLLVAAETGVPADLLTGEDEGILRAQAAALLAYRDGVPTLPPRMRPDLSQGATGRSAALTPTEIARAAYERRHGRRADT